MWLTAKKHSLNVGRYVPISDNNMKKNRKRTANERICKLCRLNEIENEYHFLCVCPVYNNRRTILFEEIELKHLHFHTLSLSDKFIFCNEALPNRSIKVCKRGMVY